jgi:S-adenosylmethionine-diacylgycerolhomoserine-N-methlytransferase
MPTQLIHGLLTSRSQEIDKIYLTEVFDEGGGNMSRAPVMLTHRDRMSRYYGFHSTIYDATRWMFLFDRKRIVQDLALRPGETVIEIGCGTGHNFETIMTPLESRGRLIAVDCSKPMLKHAARRIRKNRWQNVTAVDVEYGSAPINEGQTDVVLMSYSLSMIPNWQSVLKTAKAELKPGGRIGIVDFWYGGLGEASEAFAGWLHFNHVEIDRPYENVLTAMFDPLEFHTHNAFGGLWQYFRFIGVKKTKPGSAVAPPL